MNNNGNRPKANFIQKARLEDLFNWTQKRTHDLEDYLYEIVFLERLIVVYFIKLLLNESIEDLRGIQKDIATSRTECENILKELYIYSLLILDFIEESNNSYTPVFREGCQQFEDEILVCMTSINENRSIVSSIIKSAIKDEKPKYTWKYN